MTIATIAAMSEEEAASLLLEEVDILNKINTALDTYCSPEAPNSNMFASAIALMSAVIQ